jgi:V/A-type H+-transporting ATPase subunit I
LSIVELRHADLVGIASEKEAMLDALQELGCLQLELGPVDHEPGPTGAPASGDATKALRYLLATARKRHARLENDRFDVDRVVEQTLANRDRLRDLQDERDALLDRIAQVEPWGAYTLPPEEELGGYRLWFYVVPLAGMRELGELDLVWQEVHRDQRQSWVVVVARDEPAEDALPAPRVHVGSRTLVELREALEKVEVELDEVLAERESLTRWIFLIAQNMAHSEDQAMLREAAARTEERDGLFLLRAWVPLGQLELVEAFAQENDLALLIREPLPDEAPPTLLENPPELAGGQALVQFYQTPDYRSWDPSIAVFFSFTTFFAMIVADAGYALVLAGLLGLFWQRMGQTPQRQSLRRLVATTLCLTAVYGALVGSYFGASPPESHWLSRLAVIDLGDFDSMIQFSIGIGCLHVILANALKIYGIPLAAERCTAAGWILVICGGAGVWLLERGGMIAKAAIGIGVLGLALVALGAAAAGGTGNGNASAWRRIGASLLALTNVSRIFGDVLSYLRLWALGLASASLGALFNDLASDAASAYRGMGLFLAILILLVGHVLNLTLAVVGGVVHGLRLNFIEFFNWSGLEEGSPFQAFAKKEIEP